MLLLSVCVYEVATWELKAIAAVRGLNCDVDLSKLFNLSISLLLRVSSRVSPFRSISPLQVNLLKGLSLLTL